MASWRTLPWETEPQKLSQTEKTAMLVGGAGIAYAFGTWMVGTFSLPDGWTGYPLNVRSPAYRSLTSQICPAL
jgi:hypothetical protein